MTIAQRLGVTDAQLRQLAKAAAKDLAGKIPYVAGASGLALARKGLVEPEPWLLINDKGRALLKRAREMGW